MQDRFENYTLNMLLTPLVIKRIYSALGYGSPGEFASQLVAQAAYSAVSK
jgi:hypothetical protein